MAKRGDNIRKRKDGRWEGRYKKGRRHDGTIRYGSVYGKSYAEVKKKLKDAETFKETASVHQDRERQGGEKTFGEILNLWMDNNRLRLKGATINKYQNLIDTHILPAFGYTKISDLTATTVNAYLSEKMERGRLDKKGGLSPSYVKSIMLVINAAIRFAVKEEMCALFKIPISKPTLSKTELRILSFDEQRKLENYLQIDTEPSKLGILLSLHTGLRIGEVCALSWDDIDFANRIIKVRHTVARVRGTLEETNGQTRLIIDSPKTKASVRDIPIPSILLHKLISLRKISTSRYVISDK